MDQGGAFLRAASPFAAAGAAAGAFEDGELAPPGDLYGGGGAEGLHHLTAGAAPPSLVY